MSEAPSKFRSLIPGLVAGAIAIAVYAATLAHRFAYDDAEILRSPLLSRPWDLRGVFTGGFYAHGERIYGLYRPLGQWGLLLNAALAKALTGGYAAPAVYHVVNVLLHAAASFLLFTWLASLSIPRRVAGAAAILWAVLPVHAEVAANIASRTESQALVFALGFLLAHRHGRDFLAAALLLAALWSKESSLAFLPLAFFAAALFPREGGRPGVRSLIPSCAVSVLWLVLRAVALSGEEFATPYVENPVASASLGIRWMTAAGVQLLYLRDQILPLWLSTDHSFRQIAPLRTVLDPLVLGFVGLLVLAGALAWRLRGKRPEIALGVLGYAVLFSVTSNFLVPTGTIMADRLAYAPSSFTCLLLAVVLVHLRPKALATATVAVVAIGFAYRSYAASRVWVDDLTLFQDQVRTAPESAKSHGNLGGALRDLGRMEEAVVEYKKSIEIYPYRPEPYLGLGVAYETLREDPELLINTWADSIRFGTLGERPVLRDALSAVDLGDWEGLFRIRDGLVAADPEDRFILRIDRILHAGHDLADTPRSGEDWARGNLLFRLGDYAEAEAKYRRALHHRDFPPNEVVHTLLNMATCDENLKRPARAEHLRKLAAEWSAKPRR